MERKKKSLICIHHDHANSICVRHYISLCQVSEPLQLQHRIGVKSNAGKRIYP